MTAVTSSLKFLHWLHCVTGLCSDHDLTIGKGGLGSGLCCLSRCVVYWLLLHDDWFLKLILIRFDWLIDWFFFWFFFYCGKHLTYLTFQLGVWKRCGKRTEKSFDMSLPMWHDVCVIDFAMSKCQKNIQASIKDIDESLRLMTSLLFFFFSEFYCLVSNASPFPVLLEPQFSLFYLFIYIHISTHSL